MHTAVLVIDVQVGLVNGAYQEASVLENINRVIAKVRAADGTVIFIQHCHATYKPLMKGADGWALHPALDVKGHDIRLDKTASDSFYETELAARLNALNLGKLYVTGLQTEYCVDATCRSAQSKKLPVVLIADAHTTGDSHMTAKSIIAHHNEILANLAHPDCPIQVVSSEEI